MTDTKTRPPGEPAAGLHPSIGALVRSLLIETDLGYEAILEEVCKAFPDAKTTVRSIASVASIARKKGQSIGLRRKPTKALKRDSGSVAALPASLVE